LIIGLSVETVPSIIKESMELFVLLELVIL
jgi:hypothetical protein